MQPSRDIRHCLVWMLVLAGWVALWPACTYAGAWTLPPGVAREFATYRYYRTTSFFDADGQKRDKNGSFKKHEWRYFGEYGWRENWTIGGEAAYSYERDEGAFFQTDPQTDEMTFVERDVALRGFNDVSFFARYQLYRDSRYAVAIEPRLRIPGLYIDNSLGPVAEQDGGAELALLAGRNLTWLGRRHYVDMRIAYRYRRGPVGDQYRARVSGGLSLTDSWQLLPALDHIRPVGSLNRRLVTLTGRNDMELTQASLSALYRVNASYQIAFGGFSHLDGRNTGAGGGVLLSLRVQYDGT